MRLWSRVCTFIDQLSDDAAYGLILLLPPAIEKGRLHVDKAASWILLKLLHHRVQDVLNPGMLDIIAVCALTYVHMYTDVLWFVASMNAHFRLIGVT